MLSRHSLPALSATLSTVHIVPSLLPTFGWLGIPRRSFHPAGDRSLRDIKAKHEDFAMDARGTPRCVFGELVSHGLGHSQERWRSASAASSS